MRTLTIAAFAALLFAVPSAAQRTEDGLSGTRVRVTSPNFLPAPVTGTVSSYTQQGITVVDEVTGDTILLPLRSVSRLDKFAGGSAGSTAWYRGRWGAFIGLGLGAIAGAPAAKLFDMEMGEGAAVGALIGAGSGFVLGAAFGAAAPRERWTWTMQPWGYDPSLRPQPSPPPPPPPAVVVPAQPTQPVSPPPAQPQPTQPTEPQPAPTSPPPAQPTSPPPAQP